jgi:HD-GYP domain-containing protein (c-di-GMP phosphodiesterase class II)
MGYLTVLTAALERRDPYTRGHCDRVTTLARHVAARLACDDAELASIELGGPVHDIGKLSVPDDVLLKPGGLDESELERIRKHPVEGARMLRGIRALRAAVPCVLHHHERWDGQGYPFGLAGDEIPKPARILAVADAFDAMTSARPYRAALPVEVALDEVRRCAGTQFDPAVSAAFIDAWAAA